MSLLTRSPVRYIHHGTLPTTTFFFDASGVTVPDIIYSPRRELTSWTGACWKVYKGSTDTVGQDVGFLSNGDLDEAAITAYCGANEGRVGVVYDQRGRYNWTEATWAEMPRCYYLDSTTGTYKVEKQIGPQGGTARPTLRAPSAAAPVSLTSATFPAQTGNSVTAVVVGMLTDGGTTAPPQYSPRYISLLPANTALTDSDQTGAFLVSRNGGATSHTQEWAIQRAGAVRANQAGTYNVLQQVTAQISGSNYSLSVDGQTATSTATLSNFNYTRVTFGSKGDANMNSTNMCLSGAYIYFSAPAASELQLLQKNLVAYYGTSTQTTSTPIGRTNLPQFTLIFDEDFNTDCAEGQFLNVYGSRFYAYPSTGRTTYGKNANTGDHYATSWISVVDGEMVIRMNRGPDGKCWGAAPFPKLQTKWPYSSMLYGRVEVKVRATTTVPGWKIAPELWPDSDVWPRDGELDWPDMSLTGNVGGFYHYMNGTSGSDQNQITVSPSKKIDVPRLFVIEWKPNSLSVFLDDVLIKQYTSRVLSSPMHYIFQCENRVDPTQPALNGPDCFVFVDHMSVWSWTP